jgi:hypothetical protein
VPGLFHIAIDPPHVDNDPYHHERDCVYTVWLTVEGLEKLMTHSKVA